MAPETQENVLRHVVQEWAKLPAGERPWGIWITRHGPVPEDLVELRHEAHPANHAWFLDDRGLREASVWSFRRFYVTQFVQPWCRSFCQQAVLTNSHHLFPIAMAAIAPYAHSRDVYLEITFGPLSGRAYRITINEDTRLTEMWAS